MQRSVHRLQPAIAALTVALLAGLPAASGFQACIDWTDRTIPNPPPARTQHAMAYDSGRGVTVMFGGFNNTPAGFFKDTWEWTGAAWGQRHPATSPPGREDHAMAYDSDRGVTVMFGGYHGVAGDYTFGDTWEWDGINWTDRTPAVSPPPRYWHAMAYDRVRHRVVLFGGTAFDGVTQTPLGDTWEWDGTNWTQLNPATSPSARNLHAMTYDSDRNVIVLFGGGTSSLLGDTWEWDGATTTWTQRSPTTSPPRRMGHSMAYDTIRHATVLFGGNSTTGLAGDTWEWKSSANTWIQHIVALHPSNRTLHAMAYDAARGTTVLFGGSTTTFLNDTWIWNGTAWSLPKPVISPSPRTGVAMAYDSFRHVTVLFGGSSNTNPFNPTDTWEWDGGSWTKRTPTNSPPGRAYHAMSYDSTRHVTVLNGGTVSGNLSDTWEWDGTNWTQRAVAGPPARNDHAMVYDSVRHVTVLFGGRSNGDLGDTWEWNGTTWTQRFPAGRLLSARNDHGMAYDSARQRTVLFGGLYLNGNLRDTWEWDGTSWLSRLPVTSPAPRFDHTMAYDTARGVTVLFAGHGSNVYNDTWEWDGTDWLQRNPATSPPAREDHAMVYDSDRGVMVMFGGAGANGRALSDTWELGLCP